MSKSKKCLLDENKRLHLDYAQSMRIVLNFQSIPHFQLQKYL